MLILDIDDAVLEFNNVSGNDLPGLLNLYNNVDDYKFATGLDKPLTLKELYHKYAETLVCKDEFFIGIELKKDSDLIGIIKGGVNNKVKNALWINSVIIDKKHQNKGYGKRAISKLIDYFKYNYRIDKTFISVVEENKNAKEFWSKLGFVELRKMDNHIMLDNIKQDVVIMGKELNN